ncbi:tail sheath [Lactobacillus phage LBR48]|uniref:Putative structure protein n=1 Tax=Lactobacillus phage LBR48 TaxID=755164 RepID=D6PSY3_9CAUD|nr:tail sheath [Lactobacillus phage LBR48]ADF83474.1 putative structure protein [Lactobacillus phage LBR48]
MTVATKIGDILVTIDVNHPVIPVGLGVPGLFIKGDAQNDQVYSSLDALEIDYAEGTDIYKVAAAYYAQPNAGTTIEVITYTKSTTDTETKATTGGISAAAAAYFFSAWHFAVVIGDNDADQLELSNYIEEQNFKFLVAEFPTPDAAKAYTNKRTINLIHKATTDNFPVAFLGRVANQTVGSVTWKGKGDLVGVEVDDLSYPEYAAIEAAHGICYVVKGTKAVSSNGWTASGDWIDVLHGSDWVKVNIESSLQDLLNTQDKITFDDLWILLNSKQLLRRFSLRPMPTGLLLTMPQLRQRTIQLRLISMPTCLLRTSRIVNTTGFTGLTRLRMLCMA